ncbi:MAG: hypothetical protein HY048_10000 [Acidobacteria bacterium]|nr:hypothetical protein [Acidobacteriota bacterium]
MIRRHVAAAALIGLAAVCRPALAHPPGTTVVDLTVRDGRFEADLTIDAEALRLKEAALGRPVADLVALVFDGVAVQAAAQTTTSPDGQTALVRLTGVTPPGATSVTWRSALVYGAYLVSIREEGSAPVVQWLQGPQASRPYQLHPRQDSGARNSVIFALALAASSLLIPRSARG